MRSEYGRKCLWMVLFALILVRCDEDRVVDPQDGGASVAALMGADSVEFPMPENVCSDMFRYRLNDEEGYFKVTFCEPCTGKEPAWGNVDVFNSDSAIFFNVRLAPGWFAEGISVFAGSQADIAFSEEIPSPDSSWNARRLPSPINAPQFVVPARNLPTCFEYAFRVTVIRRSRNGDTMPKSRYQLWLRNPEFADSLSEYHTISPLVNRFCQGHCGPLVTSLKGGDCVGCESSNEVAFYECDTVKITSCKDLSRVILVFEDCSELAFDDLEAPDGKFYGSGAQAGLAISHVYVTSGCYETPGRPGFGRRFESPCSEIACMPELDFEVEFEKPASTDMPEEADSTKAETE